VIDFGFGVALGPVDQEHKDIMRAWRNSYAVWKWCRQHDVISDQDHDRWLKRQSEDPSIRMYLVYADKLSTPVGVCGFTSIDYVNRRAEFSLYIDPQKRGNAYGREALRTLVTHGFRNLGLNGIWGESFSGNPAIKMFKDIGFSEEGIRRAFYFRDGKFIDAHLISVLESEWKCLPAPSSR